MVGQPMKKIKVLLYSIRDEKNNTKHYGVMDCGFNLVLPAIYETNREVFKAVGEWNAQHQTSGPILSLIWYKNGALPQTIEKIK